MDRWEYFRRTAEGNRGTGEPTSWTWKGWRPYGRIMLADVRESVDGKSRILFQDLAVYGKLPEELFTKTSAVEIP